MKSYDKFFTQAPTYLLLIWLILNEYLFSALPYPTHLTNKQMRLNTYPSRYPGNRKETRRFIITSQPIRVYVTNPGTRFLVRGLGPYLVRYHTSPMGIGKFAPIIVQVVQDSSRYFPSVFKYKFQMYVFICYVTTYRTLVVFICNKYIARTKRNAKL